MKAIKATLESSAFFNTHEVFTKSILIVSVLTVICLQVIGSSLLFVHDRYNANVWLIDFAKTVALPDDIQINHTSKWKVGNHEDGYLVGVNNLIKIFMAMLEQQAVTVSPPLSLQEPTTLQRQDDDDDNT